MSIDTSTEAVEARCQHLDHVAHDRRSADAALLRALAAERDAAYAVAVKPLTFSDEGFAHNGLGTMYRITWHNDPAIGWVLYRHEGSSKTGLGAHEDRDQLVDLANQDNQRRILSALSPQPPVTQEQAARVLLADPEVVQNLAMGGLDGGTYGISQVLECIAGGGHE